MLEQPLMEHNIKGPVVEWTTSSITHDEHDFTRFNELPDQTQALSRVIYERHIAAQLTQLEAVAAGASPDFEYLFPGYVGDLVQFFSDICDGWIDGVWMLASPEFIPDVPTTVGLCYS
jgi:hypothetical protein